MSFEITDRAAAGRLGRFQTGHGRVTTPTLLPVVNPNIDLVTPREMADLGAEMVITNSYVIHKHETLRTHALQHGVHDLIGWDGPLMTDSGTFQMYVYGDVEVGPEEIVAFQADMGVDVATCLDLFVTPEMSRQEAEEAVATTLERTRLSADVLARHRTGADASEGPGHASTILNATVQGGLHADLRQACAGAYRDLDVGYHTIGGVVPVMEQQMYPGLVDIILHSQSQLRKDRPVHLFGAGHPLVFPLATALGCDLFDSSSYAKYAKDGRVMTPEGTLHVRDLDEWPFSSRFLDGWRPQELARALSGKRRSRLEAAPGEAGAQLERIHAREAKDPRFGAERALALHNLDVCFTDIRRIRQAIRDGVLWELVEQRAACHPMLAAATRRLREPAFQEWLEAREPLSGGKALRYTGSLTHGRPVFRRIRDRLLERYVPTSEPVPAMVETPYAKEGEEKREVAMHKEPEGKPFGIALGDRFDGDQEHVVVNALGPTPYGLDEAYPFAQSVLPRLEGLDRDHMGWVGETKDRFLEAHDLMPAIPGPPMGDGLDRDLLQVLRTADWQFGAGAGALLVGMLESAQLRDAYQSASERKNAHAEDGAPAAGDDATAGGGHQAQAMQARSETRSSPGIAGHVSGALAEAPAGDFRCERSRRTDKLRTVHRGEHILSLRAQDGLFTLKPAGARLLHAGLPAPAMRVVVEADSVPFNRDGKSVFAKFVVDADPALRPGDECLVVGPDDALVAVGQVLLNREEMMDFETGMAVKVRDGIPA